MSFSCSTRHSLIRCAALLLCLTGSSALFATERLGVGEETFKISMGAFIVDLDNSSRLSTDFGSDLVDLQKDFGLNAEQSVFRIDGSWRFAPNHRILLNYYQFNQSNSKRIQRDIEWNDTLYPIDTTVKFTLDWELITAGYAYSFYKESDIEAAVSVGLHNIELGVGLEAGALKERSSLAGPLPHIGLHVDYQPHPDWITGVNLKLFALEYEEYDGTLVDAGLYAEYLFGHNWSLGLGYNYFNLNVDISEKNWNGNVEYSYSGLQGYLSKRF